MSTYSVDWSGLEAGLEFAMIFLLQTPSTEITDICYHVQLNYNILRPSLRKAQSSIRLDYILMEKGYQRTGACYCYTLEAHDQFFWF